MVSGSRGPRDPDLLDAIDASAREAFEGKVWRVVREGRDPTLGAPSHSRWCDGSFEVLYTALAKDGAIAEIHAFLSAQPVFPSKPRWFCHELLVRARRTLRLLDMDALAALGVDVPKYRERRYGRTQAIAEAAHFLEFDGLIAPSARFPRQNLMLFTDRLDEGDVVAGKGQVVDWGEWRGS